MSQAHAPVMLSETLDAFRAAKSVRAAWDGTFGRGGHARATLDQFPDARLWAMDMDEAAIAHGREAFAREVAEGRAHFTRAPYVRFKELRAQFPEAFDAMLLDLGVSSPQLDEAERGFSFYHDGPLDMRMDRTQETTAATVINEWDEEDLARLFIELGEVPRPFRVVRAIAHDRKSRPFRTTLDLAGLIERVDGWRKKGSHPATKYFLALRLEVNAGTAPARNRAAGPRGRARARRRARRDHVPFARRSRREIRAQGAARRRPPIE